MAIPISLVPPRPSSQTSYLLPGNLINFNKRRLISTILREVQQYQDKPMNLRHVPEIASLIAENISLKYIECSKDPEWVNIGNLSTTTLPSIKAFEDALFQTSLEREPRGAERSSIA